jgi:hypothetical protein
MEDLKVLDDIGVFAIEHSTRDLGMHGVVHMPLRVKLVINDIGAAI